MDVRTRSRRDDARSRLLRAFCYAAALPLALFCLAVALSYGFYWLGLAGVPAELPRAQRAYPAELRRLYWRAHGGQGEIRLPRLSAPRVAWKAARALAVANPARGQPSAAIQILTQAARAMHVQLEPPTGPTLRRHQAELSLGIALSRERSGEQLIDYLLERSHFGLDAGRRPLNGIVAAAAHYYGLPPERLNAAEQIALLVLPHGASYFDPACHPERFRRRYAFLLGRAGLIPANTAEQSPPARMRIGACTTTRRP
ncbi:transglycosylase domain-containing protein [Lysobacter firmicutimachus]|uniref:Transglycosylase domain-containing protein n=1 Tax=Lysobacter firmicutimachus TaxID=1792846 RepID=A0AAU8MRE1_9GAMM|nr:transglycosylase domain-containing protein [Lysobacter antibioticus]